MPIPGAPLTTQPYAAFSRLLRELGDWLGPAVWAVPVPEFPAVPQNASHAATSFCISLSRPRNGVVKSRLAICDSGRRVTTSYVTTGSATFL